MKGTDWRRQSQVQHEIQEPQCSAEAAPVNRTEWCGRDNLAIVLVDHARRLPAAHEHAASGNERPAPFDEVVATQQLIEEQQHESAGCGNTKTERADRGNDVSLPEIGYDAAADDGDSDAHRARGHRAAR